MRIAIANDLHLACEALRRVVLSVKGLEVAWIARDGVEAVEHAQRDRPDLILMDLLMPRMDGVEATRRIMASVPCPILVVTATVQGRIDLVYEAMGCGALDAVDTPCLGAGGQTQGGAALLQKIVTIGKLLGTPLTVPRGASIASDEVRLGDEPLVLFGASTGGPRALKEILRALSPRQGVSVLMVQHVDVAFAPGMVSWLAEDSRTPVGIITEEQRPAPGKALLACTNDHVVLDHTGRLRYVVEPREACYRPSVDVFFNSVASHWPSPGVAVLLTGMGRDGAAGLLRLRRQGWHTIAQDEATSVVWGMPRAAAECNAAERVLPLCQVAAAIQEWVG